MVHACPDPCSRTPHRRPLAAPLLSLAAMTFLYRHSMLPISACCLWLIGRLETSGHFRPTLPSLTPFSGAKPGCPTISHRFRSVPDRSRAEIGAARLRRARSPTARTPSSRSFREVSDTNGNALSPIPSQDSLGAGVLGRPAGRTPHSLHLFLSTLFCPTSDPCPQGTTHLLTPLSAHLPPPPPRPAPVVLHPLSRLSAMAILHPRSHSPLHTLRPALQGPAPRASLHGAPHPPPCPCFLFPAAAQP